MTGVRKAEKGREGCPGSESGGVTAGAEKCVMCLGQREQASLAEQGVSDKAGKLVAVSSWGPSMVM